MALGTAAMIGQRRLSRARKAVATLRVCSHKRSHADSEDNGKGGEGPQATYERQNPVTQTRQFAQVILIHCGFLSLEGGRKYFTRIYGNHSGIRK